MALRVVESAVQQLELGAQAVQPLEHGVELPVVEGPSVSHAPIVRMSRGRILDRAASVST